MADQKEGTGGPVYTLPHERATEAPAAPEDSLFDLLTSEDEPEAPEDQDEPASEDLEDEDTDDEPAEDSDEEDDEGDPEDDEELDDGEDEEPEVEVTLPGGKKAKVTLSELKKGYSRTQDYTRKTQEIAEQRKALEAEKTETSRAREEYGQRLELLDEALKQLAPAEPDWDKLRKENPAEYAALRADFQQRERELAAVAAERAKLQEEQRAAQVEQYKAYLKEEQEKLNEVLPAWKDEKVRKKEQAAIFEFAKGLGYSEAELSQVADHRVVLVLRDAMRYRQLKQKGKETVAEKAKTAPVLKPGGRTVTPQQKRRKSNIKRASDRLARSGRTSDAAAVIFEMLDD